MRNHNGKLKTPALLQLQLQNPPIVPDEMREEKKKKKEQVRKLEGKLE